VACDLEPRYLGAWPLARRAWRDVAGVEPLLVLVADEEAVPLELRADPSVRVFAPVAGIHTAFQAQCIRLLYPALLDCEGVVVADVDMAPLAARYFHRPVSRIPREHFVAYRDVLLDLGEIPICYNAALPGTWGDIFGVASESDVRDRLVEWAHETSYSGRHGGEGWTSDQRILYRTLLDRGRTARDVWILDDWFTGYDRLERTALLKWGTLDERRRSLVARGAYSDFHFPLPYEEYRELCDLVVDLAAEG
jgi:hypothetical protein